MESSKSTRNILFSLLYLLVLVLIGFSVYQHLQLKKLSRAMNYESNVTNESPNIEASDIDRVAQNNTPQSTPPEGSLKDSNKIDFNDIEERLEATEEKLDTAHQKLSDELSKLAEIKKKEEEYLKQMSADSKKRDQDRFISNLHIEYGPLFKELNLSPNKLNALKQLLIDKRAESIDISVETIDGMYWTTMSDNPIKAEEYNEKIRQFLGNADYEKYITYEESSRERYWVNQFIKSGSTGETLTEDQQQALIKSMYKNRENIKAELENYGTPADSPYEMDDEQITMRMKRTERIDEVYVEAVKIILSAPQTEQFEKYLKERRDLVESQLKLQAETFGKNAAQKDADKKTEY